MRESINGNPVVQAVFLGVLLLACAFLLLHPSLLGRVERRRCLVGARCPARRDDRVPGARRNRDA